MRVKQISVEKNFFISMLQVYNTNEFQYQGITRKPTYDDFSSRDITHGAIKFKCTYVTP